MIDFIITKFMPLCFKMSESFENLDNILRDWAKDKVQKSLAKRQVQKSDWINSDCQSESDELGSTRIDSDRLES